MMFCSLEVTDIHQKIIGEEFRGFEPKSCKYFITAQLL